MVKIKIRKARKEDFDGILNVFLDSAILNPKEKGEKYLKNYIRESLRNRDFLIFVAEEDNFLIGICISQLGRISKSSAELIDLYVLKKYRGNKIGSKLMQTLYKKLKEKRIKNLGLYSENKPLTLNFYKKQGFQIGRLIRRCDKKLK